MRKWNMKNTIPATHLNTLVTCLRELFPNLQTDFPGIVSTPRTTKVQLVVPISYIHIGIRTAVPELRKIDALASISTVQIQLLIHDLHPFVSSQVRLWSRFNSGRIFSSYLHSKHVQWAGTVWSCITCFSLLIFWMLQCCVLRMRMTVSLPYDNDFCIIPLTHSLPV